MYEITQKGAWFKWSALDPVEKKLAALSLAASFPPGLVIGSVAGEQGYRAGYELSSGRQPPRPSHFGELSAELVTQPVILVALFCALISAIAWWRFSVRQDELFNRIQNRALGHASSWSVGAAGMWWFLARADVVGDFPLGLFLIFATLLLYYFWFSGVRRWA